jgi:hypothetical protein
VTNRDSRAKDDGLVVEIVPLTLALSPSDGAREPLAPALCASGKEGGGVWNSRGIGAPQSQWMVRSPLMAGVSGMD